MLLATIKRPFVLKMLIFVDIGHNPCENDSMKNGNKAIGEVALAAIFAAFALGAEAMTPGGVEKKCVGLYFDVMNTTPSNILANADQFAPNAPYLDGVAIGLHGIPVAAEDGNVVTSQYRYIMHKTERWTRDALKDQIPYLREIVKKPCLSESFLLFWMTPGGSSSRIDWTDDKGWANYAENMAAVTWLAKEGGLKGLMLDPEEYGAQGGKYAQYIHSYMDPPYRETAKLARQRGREVFSRVFKEFPDAVIFSLWCFHKFRYWFDNGRQPYPLQNVEQSGELLQCFMNGMIDVMPPGARIVDGMEVYTGSALDNSFANDYVAASITALPLIEPENIVKYRSQFLFGNAHYVDMYVQTQNPKSVWYFGPVNGSRLEHLRLNLEQSFRSATEYVWFYGERGGKLFNWRDGHYAKQKTWEEVIPGFTETAMLAKDPIGYSAMRKAELAAKGQLVNLAMDVAPISIGYPDGEREFHLREYNMPAVKVKPGERYAVVMKTEEHGVEKGTTRQGAAMPRIFWRPVTKQNEKRIPLTMHYDKGPDAGGCYGSTIVIEVPEGARELVCDPGASIGIGERVSYRSITVFNLFDPVEPVRSDRQVKWTFDPEKNTLTDGCWTLSATPDKKNGTLTVRGEDEKTIGSGVLDFTTVKADTGYAVTALGKLKNIPAMTALHAPDLVKVVDGGIAGCSNVTAVTTGEILKPWWARLPEEIRGGRLEALGCQSRQPLNFKAFDHRHKRTYVEFLSDKMRIKGLKPGDLYSIGLSMKRSGPGFVFLFPRFRGQSGWSVRTPEPLPKISMSQPREDGVWQSGEIVLRVPEGADEICLDIKTEITEGATSIELGDFKVYRIGGPLPVWPEEFERQKPR